MEQGREISTFDDATPRPVIALGIDYPDGYVQPLHRHRRAQLLHGFTGVVLATTSDGAWMMPPQCGLWIPPGVMHEVHMLGAVRMRNLYLEPDAVPGMPGRCRVMEITPLMRGLLSEAAWIEREYDVGGRDGAVMALIQHELGLLPALPLSLSLPRNAALARRCRAFLREPTTRDTIDDWRADLDLSRRSFTRLFRRETGESFTKWRQQACVMAALPRLTAGQPVTAVALEFGYENPAAFSTMFRRILGMSPRAYLEREG